MDFSSASKVLQVLRASDQVEFLRAQNRDKINRSLNGFPPLTTDQAKKVNLKINVNWLEEAVIAKQATLQFANAFTSQNNYFGIQIQSLPPEKKSAWELTINDGINKPLKKSREFASLLDSVFTSVVSHGVAPTIWLSTDKWLPDFIALGDFRVPTDTQTNLKNLGWFAIRRRYTVGELVNAVFGKYADNGWVKPEIINILAAYWDLNFSTTPYDWQTNIEKMTELVKQNMIYYTSDSIPVITLWHFYHLDDEEPLTNKWLMKVVSDITVTKGDQSHFLFVSDEPVADCIDELLHIQYGDLNSTPPFMHHSVRSLGFMLHEPCYWMNLTRCRALQYTWENFNMLLRGTEGGDKARAQKVELFDKGWIPEGVAIVPRDQRHQIDQPMVEFMMAQMKQLMGEASLSYTQDADNGTQREQTLGEAQIKLQQANALMAGIANIFARNIVFFYREICRRFCNKKSLDPDVRKFWKKIKAAGIPSQFINEDLWDIHPDSPLGNGNQTLQMAQATQLMAVRSQHSPDAQMEILHQYDAAVTQNPRMANRLVPLDKKNVFSDGQAWASATFGTLMQGSPLPIKGELNPIDQISTLLALSAGVIHKIESTDNVGTPDEVLGLNTVFGQVSQLINWLSQDAQNKQQVKQFSASLGQLQNLTKAFGQRQAEKAQAQQQAQKLSESLSIKFTDLAQFPQAQQAILQQNGLPSNRVPIADPQVQKVGQEMQIKEQKFQQDQAHKDAGFLAEQHRKSLETQSQIESEGLKTGMEVAKQANHKIFLILCHRNRLSQNNFSPIISFTVSCSKLTISPANEHLILSKCLLIDSEL